MEYSIYIFISLAFIKLCFTSIPEFIATGPGLKPELTVLPARYFYLYLNNTLENVDLHSNALEVSISGLTSKKTQCRIWKQILDLKDNSFIVRYRLYETCYDLAIVIQFNTKHIAGSPLFFKGPVQPEECNCPENDINKWLAEFGCTKIHKQIRNDLSSYSKVHFETFYDKAVKRFNNSFSSSVCHYVIKSNKVYRSCYGQHVGFKMFMDAILLSLTRKVVLPDFEFFSNLGDWPLMKKQSKDNFPLFSWCGSDDTIDIVMPTYDITGSTLENMGRVSLDMLSVQGNIERKWHEKENKAFWRGRDSSLERLKLIEISRKYPDMINASLTNFFFFRDQQEKYGPKVDHISFFKFFDHKYQLNLDGTVAAYRFPYLLVGDSVVLKQDSKYYEHFYDDLEPWVHYIPVRSDLSDLIDQLKWAMENDRKAQDIAEAGREYARNNLMPEDIFCYHANLFHEWSKKLEGPVRVRNGMDYVEDNNDKGCVCKYSEKDEL